MFDSSTVQLNKWFLSSENIIGVEYEIVLTHPPDQNHLYSNDSNGL